MFTKETKFINFQDNLYKVVRIFISSKIPEIYVADLKAYYKCDIALRAHNFLYLCELCPEVEIIEDEELTTESTLLEDKIIE
jgi:hypothetical protein